MSFPRPSIHTELTDLEKHLVATYWDDTIDGDSSLFEDVESFLDPFLNTIRIQKSQ